MHSLENPFARDPHLCSDHAGEGPSIWNLPGLPDALRREWLALETRRHFLGRGMQALGWAGLASLLGRPLAAQTAAGPAVLGPHYAPRAKRAIYLFMAGSPSQFETWDHKPVLQRMFDQDLPESVRGGQVLTGMTASQARFPIAPSIYKFAQHGQAGHWVSELFPHTARIGDELCVLKSLHTEAINHEPAILQLTTGNMFPGRPSLGSWLSYGLGAMNDELPTFVVMTSTTGWARRRCAARQSPNPSTSPSQDRSAPSACRSARIPKADPFTRPSRCRTRRRRNSPDSGNTW